ncbi:FAD-binding oxidoreductase [Microbacterium sp. zg.B48]|uniref:FAD-binding oxidoreductase n=1 Tax=Microbacterium sp. zg.B48 TaxID=2969408 RepID=UPI00214C3322|nr:FAD-binding oxidoreductase [Microbacterium sp. zg.B48]MCR2762329.1 FAD-binding oxidoreductase [Microbacterium sp. zg.B48]
MRIDGLISELPGRALAPGDDGWEAARHFHSGVGQPDVIVRAASVDDVAAAVRWASAEGVPIAVRGGGHSAWGALPGGLTLDLAALSEVEVDGTLVRVGGGAVWGHVAGVLAQHGLGLSSGDTASVGVGGLTLGGGIGWMVRSWGLAADQLVGVQIVSAAGALIEATDASHPELMWALRGGGGNFGVVTRFDFRAHELPAVVFATLAVTGPAEPMLRALREVMKQAPRELTVTYMDVPPMDPNAAAGASVSACWAGADEAAARAALAPLLALDGVEAVEFGARSYPGILIEAPPAEADQPMPGLIGGNTLLRELSEDAIERLASFRAANPASVLLLRSLGGAYGDVPQEATAFPARDATWFAMAMAFDIPGMLDDAGRSRVAADWDAIEALGDGFYGNFTMSTEPGLVSHMFSADTMARLAAVKREWDPANVFRRNHNIRPD